MLWNVKQKGKVYVCVYVCAHVCLCMYILLQWKKLEVTTFSSLHFLKFNLFFSVFFIL